MKYLVKGFKGFNILYCSLKDIEILLNLENCVQQQSSQCSFPYRSDHTRGVGGLTTQFDTFDTFESGPHIDTWTNEVAENAEKTTNNIGCKKDDISFALCSCSSYTHIFHLYSYKFAITCGIL